MRHGNRSIDMIPFQHIYVILTLYDNFMLIDKIDKNIHADKNRESDIKVGIMLRIFHRHESHPSLSESVGLSQKIRNIQKLEICIFFSA